MYQVSTDALKDIESSFQRGLDSTAALQELNRLKRAKGNRTPSNLNLKAFQTNPLSVKPSSISKPSPVLSALLKRKVKKIKTTNKQEDIEECE